MMTPEEMADRWQLRALVDRYARIPDDRDYALVDAVFTPDGRLAGPGFRVEGRAAIRQAMQAIERYERTLHAMHNHNVTLAGNAAQGDTYCVANHIEQTERGLEKLDWGIRYRDRFERTGDGWQIAERELQLVWEQRLPLDGATAPA